MKWAKSNWKSGNFLDVALDIRRSTPPHENKLRDEIVEIVSNHVQYLLAQDNLNDVLIENPEFTVAVLRQMVKEQTNPGSRRIVHHSSNPYRSDKF
jgi:septum formation topological specificity factor MinE